MKKYTVILLRPDYIADEGLGGYGQDIYIGQISAETPEEAVKEAQAEVYSCDDAGGLEPGDPDDYALLAVFKGHHVPILWGWEL
jgi:hypothetical protein